MNDKREIDRGDPVEPKVNVRVEPMPTIALDRKIQAVEDLLHYMHLTGRFRAIREENEHYLVQLKTKRESLK